MASKKDNEISLEQLEEAIMKHNESGKAKTLKETVDRLTNHVEIYYDNRKKNTKDRDDLEI